MKQFDKSELCGPNNGFDFSRMTVDKEVQAVQAGKKYLGNIGVTIMHSFVLSNNFLIVILQYFAILCSVVQMFHILKVLSLIIYAPNEKWFNFFLSFYQ